MSDDLTDSAETTLAEIGHLAEAIVARRVETYPAGLEIWGLAMSGSVGTSVAVDHCHALWLVWGALTDWVERRPAETSCAEAEMARAAAEWLAVRATEAGWRDYFDRWIYDELGYERPT